MRRIKHVFDPETGWPPDRSKLATHPDGYLTSPGRPHLAYCPECLHAFHPMYWPKHTRKECEESKLEFVEEIYED